MTVTFDSVCTHISDIDFSKINHYSGIILSGMNLVIGCKVNAQQTKQKQRKETRIRRIYTSF
jgi:hypothetical protein